MESRIEVPSRLSILQHPISLVSPSSTSHSKPSRHRLTCTVYPLHPGNQTAQTNNYRAASPSPLNYDLLAAYIDLTSSFLYFVIKSYFYNLINLSTTMKEKLIHSIMDLSEMFLSEQQKEKLQTALNTAMKEYDIMQKESTDDTRTRQNNELLHAFLAAKKIEGCSEKTIHYYQSTIEQLFTIVSQHVQEMTTNDIRSYLANRQEQRGLSKVTIDNLRRIFSSFFAWLEDEDYIAKSPVRRIHKVRTDTLVKEVLSDESLEILRDSCIEKRDLAMIDLLASTGMRVGELVKMNIADIDFQERQCVVFGKGNKEREVYFNARTKIHLQQYIEQRSDNNPALFVSLSSPHTRLTISGVEVRLRNLGKRLGINKVHPHKFRRTLATMAIDKGMPIEQVQKLLGHVKIDTTLHYAMVNQANVKMAHRKYLT